MTPPLLAVAISVPAWYATSVLFNVLLKRTFRAGGDVMLATDLMFAAGPLVLALLVATSSRRRELVRTIGVALSDGSGHRGQLIASSALFLGGTLCTNLSLTVLSLSFTHVVKTAEPLVSAVMVWAWRGERPKLLTSASLVLIFVGLVIACEAQRTTIFRSRSAIGGLFHGMLANCCFQGRNILNKSLLVKPPPHYATEIGGGAEGRAAHATTSVAAPTTALPPTLLLMVTLSLALPGQLLTHLACWASYCSSSSDPSSAGSTSASMTRAPPDSWPRNESIVVDHSATWPSLVSVVEPPTQVPLMLLSAAAFVTYQLCSILVLSHTHPTTHAVINAFKRGVVVAVGALLTREQGLLLDGNRYTLGASLALAGCVFYSSTKSTCSLSPSPRRRSIGALEEHAEEAAWAEAPVPVAAELASSEEAARGRQPGSGMGGRTEASDLSGLGHGPWRCSFLGLVALLGGYAVVAAGTAADSPDSWRGAHATLRNTNTVDRTRDTAASAGRAAFGADLPFPFESARPERQTRRARHDQARAADPNYVDGAAPSSALIISVSGKGKKAKHNSTAAARGKHQHATVYLAAAHKRQESKQAKRRHKRSRSSVRPCCDET